MIRFLPRGNSESWEDRTDVRLTFRRGVHPPHRKELTRECPVEVVPTPERVVLPILQHLGAPCEPLVSSRDVVEAGAMVADSESFVSAPVHTPIAGKVAKIGVATLPNGRHIPTIPIKAEGEQLEGDALWDEVYGGDWSTAGLDTHAPEAIVAAVRAAGIVGMGGAAFPTHVKLTRNHDRPVHTLLVNGCECEPYLTADDRLMREAPMPVVVGAMLAARAVRAERVVVGIEDNKADAAQAIRKAAAGTGVEVVMVRTKYPQGAEKQLIRAALGPVVPTGKLPLDIGVLVQNVATVAAVARAVLRGKPLTHRIFTVTGKGVVQPKNLLIPVGISYREVLEACGGLTSDTVRVVAGGPMMGFAIGDLDTPITKASGSVLALTRDEVEQARETHCVRCGRCVDACPIKLVPSRIALASRHRKWDLARKFHALACMECGCCAHQCPASIPLVQLIRVGKAALASR
jgi:electron transport complex protein RnfC